MSERRRWYDQEFVCRRLLDQIREMPQTETREFCARVILHFAEKLRKECQDQGMLSSIGIPGIHALYKFGHYKNRWYDENQVMLMAVGALYTLPPEGLSAIGYKLGDTFGLIKVYAQVCGQVEQPPDVKDLARICTTSLQAGVEEAREVLIKIIGPDLYKALNPALKGEIGLRPPNTTSESPGP
jgi:hypothetical protein